MTNTKVPKLGVEILEKKYYGPGEKSPEDVFLRVAKIAAIPDVIDFYTKEVIVSGSYVKQIRSTVISLFQDYTNLAERVCSRRGICIIKSVEQNENKEEFSVVWNGYTERYFIPMKDLDFMPATPTLINSGLSGMLSSCFAIRVEDSMDGIFEAVKHVAIISKMGGGCGLDFSLLRPEGSKVGNQGGVSSGPISFMRVFSETGKQVVQGGIRRAALLAGLRVDHPDILKFISCKETEGELSNFNLSVFVTDEFMNAVKNNENIELKHPKQDNISIVKARKIWDEIVEHAHKNGEPGIIFQNRLDKDDVVRGKYSNLLVNPCITGDTSILMADGFKKVIDLVGKPCKLYVDGKVYKSQNGFFSTGVKPVYRITVATGQNIKLTENHLLKSYVNKNNEKFPVEEWVEAKNIKIGDVVKMSMQSSSRVINVEKLDEPEEVFDIQVPGINAFDGNGFHLHNCGELPLNSYSSCNLASINISNCMERKDNGDYKLNENKLKYLASIGANFLDNVIDLNNYPLPQIESMTLKLRPIGLGVMGLHDAMLKAKIEYGSDESIHFINDVYKLIKAITVTASQDLGSVRGIPEDLDVFCIGRRNGYLLTCPPTGTISIISGCSSGIEPVFQFEYTRKDSFGEHKVKHFILDEFDINNLPEYAKTALQIPPEDHVKVQAAIQKHLDESVSKTVNLPESATKEDVEKIFMLAYDLGCKSITTYRSGSRQEEVLVKKEEHTVEEHKKENLDKVKVDKKEYLRKRGRPRVLWGCTIRINTPQGRCFITINEDKFGIREVLLHIAKAGSDIVAHTEAEGRLISSALKNGTNVEELIRQLEGQRSSSVAFDNGRPVKSIPDAVAKALQEYVDCYEGFSQYIDDPIEKKEKVDKEKREEEVKVSGDICPECGEALLLKEGGCATCKNCGYSRC